MALFEVERKRRLPSVTEAAALTDRLLELGHHQRAQHTETDTYYSRPDVDYLTTVECLRVRQRGSFAEITYKPASTTDTHRAGDMIVKQETNVLLADARQANAARQLLAAVGMIEVAVVEKTRTAYTNPQRDQITVALDTITNLGTFVEVEITATDSDQAAVLLAEVEAALGITGYPVVALPYRDLVRQDEGVTT
ncbi:class IV adenylate cyclase [Streptoalloteichus hindustanus]|uniref:Adenylate cyclase, class 2 n=1 Tax=Streptoalloteichus hindustanus TaxID=2017 RepID=A0A1M5DEH0_STRHI|nr:class IV adenylate cyclase [Streptoalloteichus hindustanus]SHF65315.1 adenylate cyclase, class 2 [Streptoalloteichus hindustanus]